MGSDSADELDPFSVIPQLGGLLLKRRGFNHGAHGWELCGIPVFLGVERDGSAVVEATAT